MITGATFETDALLSPEEAWRAANYLARTTHIGSMSQDYLDGWWGAIQMLRSASSCSTSVRSPTAITGKM